VSGRLPLFPLGTVLFPGVALPLHVFEERYRVLVRHLLELPEPERRFGVIAIRSGREVGADGVGALHEVGCVARVRRVEEQEDGRFVLLTEGTERFRLDALDGPERSEPYPTGLVTELPDDLGPANEAALLGRAVRAAFSSYLAALGTASGQQIQAPDLPPDALALGHAVAATVLVDLDERQQLLAAVDGVARLRAELALLRREVTLLGALTAAPAPELTRGPISLN
jgi:Lon protease-like protein